VAEELRRIRVAWDETRFLIGEPGRCVVVARRADDDWWIGGINGSHDPRTLDLPLPAGTTDRGWRVIGDGDGRDAFVVRDLPAGQASLHVELAPRGGVFARSFRAAG